MKQNFNAKTKNNYFSFFKKPSQKLTFDYLCGNAILNQETHLNQKIIKMQIQKYPVRFVIILVKD